jgi:hypothetical protein
MADEGIKSARTMQEQVLFRILCDDEAGARELLLKFLPGELDEIATAADDLSDLAMEILNEQLRSRPIAPSVEKESNNGR